MGKPDVGIIAGAAVLGVAVGCAASILVNRRRIAKGKQAWLEKIPASSFSFENARVFKLQGLDRSPYGNLGGADVLQCVDTGATVPVWTLVDVPGLVLYSIEVVGGKIIFLFVQVPSVPKLFDTPFLDRGVRALVEIGSDVFVASMDAVENIPGLTPLDELPAKDQSRYSIVWNTGRCGSTLMHKMLQKVGVLSFSEPYWQDKILELPSRGLDHDEVGRVFCVSAALDVLLARKSLPAHPPIFGAAATLGSAYVSFNPKGKGVLAMEPIIRSLPHAKHMLMYRDVRKVAESFGSIFNRKPVFLDRVAAFLMIWKPRPKSLGGGLRALPNKRKPTFSKAVAEAKDSGCLKEPAKPMVKIPTVHWLETMCLWKELMKNGHLKNASAASLRMEDFVRKLRRAGDKGARLRNGLTDDPELIEKILRFFLGESLEVGEDAVSLALEAFNKHSQAGDLMAKSSHSGAGVKKFLTPEDVRQIEEYVGAVPCIGEPDFVFSDSMGLQK